MTGRTAVGEERWAELAAAAVAAAGRAYCPYSRFPVGAAILTGDGRIVAGCNVENASYGLTICAERNAVFQAVAGGSSPLIVRAAVVYAPTPRPVAPCGACRQVLHEFGPDAEIRCICDGGRVIHETVGALLPLAFEIEDSPG